MATRPAFIRLKNKPFKEAYFDFDYNRGMNIKVMQKNVIALHDSIHSIKKYQNLRILEVSSKSLQELGISCSAFNMKYKGIPFECIFQSSKVFSNGSQYIEALNMAPRDAKEYVNSKKGNLEIIKFRYDGFDFPNIPRTFFYDYMYCKCLNDNEEINKEELVKYNAFTDIVFNPNRSENCQARSMCIFTYLYKNNLLDEALSDPNKFKEIVY